MSPSSRDLALGIATAVLGCTGCAAAVEAARHQRNWLYLVVAAGMAALVAGVVGQRAFPSDSAIRVLGADAAGRLRPGPWDAGVGLPLTGIRMTPVALGGLLLAVAGLSVVLFFEPTAVERHRPPPPRRALEEDDAV